MSALVPFFSARRQTLPEWEAQLRNNWSRHCRRELRRRRGGLSTFTPRQHRFLEDMLAEWGDAVMFLLAQHAQALPGEEQAQVARALAVLFGPDAEESRVAQA